MADDLVLPPHSPLPQYQRRDSNKPEFLKELFDAGAADYDHIEQLLSFGSGRWYRRQALLRAGLAHGMMVLDVAIGTGLVAREEIGIVGNANCVIGIDPSPQMLRRAVQGLGVRGVLGVAERLPFPDATFNFISMGYALRHVADLHLAFREYHRVLQPGGRLCLLEITAPRNGVGRALLKAHMRWAVPCLVCLTTRASTSHRLWKYYWDTIEACVRPEAVVTALTSAGFSNVAHRRVLGIFSEYTGAHSDISAATMAKTDPNIPAPAASVADFHLDANHAMKTVSQAKQAS